MLCTAAGCEKPTYAKGLCRRHYVMQRSYGRTTAVRQRYATGTVCSVDGCGRPVKGLGFCLNHYQLQRKNGAPVKRVREKRSHPLYVVWNEKKRAGRLCSEWNDFWVFIAGVGERPTSAILVRPNERDVFSPTNFKWLIPLQRDPEETTQHFNARKWQARKENHPQFERQRHLKRRFGITEADYAAMLKAQGGVCAICREPETAVHNSTGKVKRLAVDHHHGTGKVRALLCWDCNSTIGRRGERPELFRAMADYLEAHADDRPASRPAAG